MRIEHSAEFWEWVCADQDVAARCLHGADVASVSEFISLPGVVCMASESGGFIFRNLDGMGQVYELHTLYRKEGWGREVALAAREALHIMFINASVLLTHEQAGWWRSRPPRSQGWKLTNEDYSASVAGPVRLWCLTKANWQLSPVFKAQ